MGVGAGRRRSILRPCIDGQQGRQCIKPHICAVPQVKTLGHPGWQQQQQLDGCWSHAYAPPRANGRQRIAPFLPQPPRLYVYAPPVAHPSKLALPLTCGICVVLPDPVSPTMMMTCRQRSVCRQVSMEFGRRAGSSGSSEGATTPPYNTTASNHRHERALDHAHPVLLHRLR